MVSAEGMKDMTYIIAAIFAVALLALLGWQFHHIIVVYRRSIGTPWQKFLAAFSDSLTIVWARVVAFGGAILTFATTALPMLDPNSPTGASIAALFNADTLKYWLAGLTALGVLFEVVRRRAGSVDPVLPPAIGTGTVSPIAPVATAQ